MFYRPLIEAEKRRLDSKGWRVWTQTELDIIKRNVGFYDRVRGILSRRCKVPDCGYTISSRGEEGSFALPEFPEVCELCFHMHYALQSADMRNKYYFRNLHDEWRREQNDPKRKDRLGL